MGKPVKRFVAKGVPGGWRIWNKLAQRWWGEFYEKQPDELLEELNGLRRPDVLAELHRRLKKDKR